MNFKFPDFNFDSWLIQFYWLFDGKYRVDDDDQEFDLGENIDTFCAMRDDFRLQLHTESEFEYNKTECYLQVLILFTAFMKVMNESNEETIFQNVVDFLRDNGGNMDESWYQVISFFKDHNIKYK